MKSIKSFLNKNSENLTIFGISLVALIVGYLAVGFLKAFLVVGIADGIFIFTLLKKKGGKKNHSGLIKNEAKKKKDPKKKKKIFKIFLLIFFVLCILTMVGIVLFGFYIVSNAPKFDPDQLYEKEATILYYGDGEIMAKLGTEKREKISYDELPEVLVNAIVATEDSRYFQHNGFDLARFLKASVQQVLTGGGGGASTLTMQVVKNTFTSTKQTITRKFTDIYMAIFEVEKNYTKQEILEFYVNSPYLGDGAYGVEQACQTYFGKSAKDINLAEAALIAGLFQAPNAYDPTLHPEAAEKRRQLVLSLMYRHGYITKEEKAAASKMTVENLLVKASAASENKYQAFIDTVVAEVQEQTDKDPYSTPMEIYTTMDKDKQEYVNSIMDGTNYKWENEVVEAGISIIDVKTGAIVAVGAGRDRTGERDYNTATMINKQIGSTAKPLFDYSVGIEYENWSTYKLFMDEEYTYSDGTSINNWDRKYNGLLTMRVALAQSRNIPALKAFQQNKNSNIKTFVTGAGLSPEVDNGILHEAHAIGGYTGECPLTMSAAYAVFGNGGYYITPHSYTKIVYRENNETVDRDIEKNQILSEETAYMMTSLLQSSAQTGLGNQYNVGGAIYGAKTGTSNYDAATIKAKGLGDNAVNDLWVNAVSPDYAISVWYGYLKVNSQYTSTSYTVSHRKLFQAVAKGIFKNGSNWSKPDGVIEVEVENETNPAKLPSEYTPSNLRITELFKSGTEPTEVSDRFSKLANVTNLKSTVKSNVLTLTWTGIDTPNAISASAISTWVDSLASSAAGKQLLTNNRNSYNNSYIGNVVYQVYSKDTSGNLNLIKTTEDTSVSFNVSSSDPTTYVVKTAYSIFKDNMSDGAETKISLDSVSSVITSALNGNKSITVKQNDKYTEQSVVVMENLVDVTSKATIKTTIKNSSGNTVSSIDTSKIDTYTITYNITYGTYSDTLVRNVIISSPSPSTTS